MAGTTLKEYVVRLGFKVDEASFAKMKASLDSLGSALSNIAAVALTAAKAMELNVSRMGEKFRQLHFQAKMAKTSVSELQRMEYAGQQAGMEKGQQTQAAIAARMAFRQNPYMKQYLEGQGIDTKHGTEAMLNSLAKVTKERYSEESGMASMGDYIAGMIGMSPEELAQRQDNLDRLTEYSEQERKKQAAAGKTPEEMERAGLEYSSLELEKKQAVERGMDVTATAQEPEAAKLLKATIDVTDKFNSLNSALSSTLATIGTVVGAQGAVSALKWLGKKLLGMGKGAGAAAGEGVAGEGAALGAGEGVAAGEAAAGTGAAAGGGAMALLGPAALIAATVGGVYWLKKSGNLDKLQKWGEAHPLFGKWKKDGKAQEGGADAAESVLAPGMGFLEDRWKDFVTLWESGIAIRTGGGTTSATASRPAPSPATTTAAAPVAAASAAPMPLDTSGVLSGMLESGAAALGLPSPTRLRGAAGKIGGALGKYGRMGLAALRSGGFQSMTKAFEGWRNKIYGDKGGAATIGYGHLITAGEDFSKGLSKEQGEALFQKDYEKHRQRVLNETKGVKLSESQVGALTDLVYNIGSLKYKGKDRDILTKLKAGDMEGAAKAFMLYDTIKGKHDATLYDRRYAEAMAFRGGGEQQQNGGFKVETTINVHGVTDAKAVADKVVAAQRDVINTATRNGMPRTA